jgi:hypothetical protein
MAAATSRAVPRPSWSAGERQRSTWTSDSIPRETSSLRAIQRIKEDLEINGELAAPDDFIPVPAGWEGRSVFVAREGRLTFSHFDPYSQALGKLERAHEQDLGDVRAMIERGLVDPVRARAYFDEIEPQLFRFPAIDPRAFRRRVEEAFGRG